MNLEVFQLLNWVLAAGTSLMFALYLRERPWLLLKPSLVVVLLYHVLLQWPAALEAAQTHAFLPRALEAVLLIHGFVLIAALISFQLFEYSARTAWNRLAERATETVSWRTLLAIAVPAVVCVGIYLQAVPLTETGLFATFFSPTTAVVAREQSLKLLPNAAIAYVYFFNAKGFSLVLAAALAARWSIGRGDGRRHVLYGAAIAVLIIAVSLSGARSFGLFILLAAIGTAALLRWRQTRPAWRWRVLALLAIGLPVLPAMIGLLANGVAITPFSIAAYASDIVFARLLAGVLPEGLNFMHYAQTNGFVDSRGWPIVVRVLGGDPVNLPNVVNHLYHPDAPSTGLASTGFLFVHYAYFGLGSLGMSVLLVELLDVLLLIAARLRRPFMQIFIAVTLVNATVLVESEYSTALVTHGVLLAGAIVVAAAWLDRKLDHSG